MNMRQTLEKYHMVRRGDYVLAAVSGGADSVCMLRLLQEAAQEMDFVLTAVHVEHGIRGEESREDMRFTWALCEELGVPLRVCHVNVPDYASEHGLGFEEAARQLRYEAFDRIAEELLSEEWKPTQLHIALAHHVQDQAETVLFRLVRGTGAEGLAGMRPVSKRAQGYDLIRPLLEMRKEDIESLLKAWGQAYCVDTTNQDASYARNRLRLKVMPELTAVNARAAEHIAQAAELLGEQQDYMAEEGARTLKRIGHIKEKEIFLEIPGLLELHPALQKEVLRQALIYVAKQRKDLTSGHIGQLLELTWKQSGSRISLPYGMEAVRAFSRIRIFRRDFSCRGESMGEDKRILRQELPADSQQVPEQSDSETEVCKEQIQALLAGGKPLEIALGTKETLAISVLPVNNLSENRKKKYTKSFDYDMIKEGFSVRRRRAGDYMQMPSGHRKKLKKYLTEAKIPEEERKKLWFLTQDSRVIWIVGGRADEACELTERSQYAVCILHKEEKDEFERETPYQRISDGGTDSRTGCGNRSGYYE